MTDHIPHITSFFAAWGESYDALIKATRDLMGADGEWVAGPGIPATRGGDAAVALMEGFKAGYDMTTIDVKLVKIGQTGDTVWTERVDTMVDSQGTRTLDINVAGVMTLDDSGTVVTWTDYWDTHGLEGLTPKS